VAKTDLPDTKGEITDIGDNTYEIRYDEDAKVEIGDKTQTTKFVPSVKLYKWDDAFFELTVPTTEVKVPDLTDNILTWVTPDYTLRFYPEEKTAYMEEGGLEFEIILNKAMVGNQIELDFKSQNLEFLKQLAYDQQIPAPEDADIGVVTKTETQGLRADKSVAVSMPENAINSYAVYHQSKMHGRYKTGKAFHIWRLKAIDSKLNEAWCDVDIEENPTKSIEKTGKFTITIPKSFLDTASYPVTIDPTFGYTTLGTTTVTQEDLVIGRSVAPSSGGRIIELYVGLEGGTAVPANDWDSGDEVQMALYSVSGTTGTLMRPTSEVLEDGHAAAGFVKFKPRGGIVIENAQEYLIASARYTTGIRRDTGFTSGDSKYFAHINFVKPGYHWLESATLTNSSSRYSTYARYADTGSNGEDFGISATVGTSQAVVNARYMGGTTPDCDHMYVDTLNYYALAAGTITIALYTGGALDDPTGATRRTYAANVSVVAGWNAISVTKYKLPKNTIFWIGWAADASADPYASSSSADAGDFQTARGRWSQTTPADYDETTAMPTSPGAGSFSDFWYLVNATIEVEEEDYDDWAYNRKLWIDTTSDGADVSGNVDDFPILVRLDTYKVPFAQCNSDGSDIRFEDSSGNKLWFEKERWDNTNKLGEFWVFMPTVSGNTKQYITVYWGKSDAEDISYSFNVFRRNAGFAAVYHLNESFVDATDNEYNGTNNGSDDVEGVSARGREFVEANSDYISATLTHVFNSISTQNHRVSFWMDADDIATQSPWTRIFEARYDDDNFVQFVIQDVAGDLAFNVEDATTQRSQMVDSAISAGTEYHVVGIWEAAVDTLTLSVNGVTQSTAGATNAGPGTAQAVNIGRRTDGSALTHYDGMIDEVRIDRILRSQDWRTLRYETERKDQTSVFFDADMDMRTVGRGTRRGVGNGVG